MVEFLNIARLAIERNSKFLSASRREREGERERENKNKFAHLKGCNKDAPNMFKVNV